MAYRSRNKGVAWRLQAASVLARMSLVLQDAQGLELLEKGAGTAQAVRNKAGASGVDWHRILVLQQQLLRKTIMKKERERKKESERGREGEEEMGKGGAGEREGERKES